MSYYSIKDLEQLSGIKAHTIRIWEQRYALLKPERTATNIRLYTDEDLKTILNISCLNSEGIKISKIAELSKEAIGKKVLQTRTSSNSEHSIRINHLIVLMIELDEHNFRDVVYTSIADIGLVDTFTNILYPFLDKIGILWQIGTISPAQEHFISNIIRNVLIVETEKLGPAERGKEAVLFLSENERHEIGLLLSNYILKKNDFKTFYLGADVPYEDLKSILETLEPDMTLSAFVNPIDSDTINRFVETLGKDFPKIKHYFSGHQAVEKIKTTNKGLILIDHINDLQKIK